MRDRLFPFQESAVSRIRQNLDNAVREYDSTGIQQVISLQAPTGSGKTIIMSALIESVLNGSTYQGKSYEPNPDAIFVWLSDSPELNEQSKQKIERKANRIQLDQCVTITGDSFDKEELEDGHIYFLNTQKLAKDKDLVKHSDKRQFTIWETLANTAWNKGDRLYFIIDEAHRGMLGNDAGKATSIMQRFIKGFQIDDASLPPMPIIIGMSATAERFNSLVGKVENSILRPVPVKADEVRASGLLKDKIVIIYPEDAKRNDEMALLEAAADAWKDKCDHWENYCVEQHEGKFNPIFVIQVKDRSATDATATDMTEVLRRIRNKTSISFSEHEVVHTFGDIGTIEIDGIPVEHMNPSEIQEAKKVRVVFFKENLSTGWDCPRAEVMMSFRVANDATYVAQLLGRMVRTPKQRHIEVDESLNEVRLFLPYFNRETVKSVVDSLQEAEGGQIPVDVEAEDSGSPQSSSMTPDAPIRRPKRPIPPGYLRLPGTDEKIETSTSESEMLGSRDHSSDDSVPQGKTSPVTEMGDDEQEHIRANVRISTNREDEPGAIVPESASREEADLSTSTDSPSINALRTENRSDTRQKAVPDDEEIQTSRKEVISFVNESKFLNYKIRTARINSYLKSLGNLISLLKRAQINQDDADAAYDELLGRIHDHAIELEQSGEYDGKMKGVLDIKFESSVFDAFGKELEDAGLLPLFVTSLAGLDYQLRKAELRLENFGLVNDYLRKYKDERGVEKCKVDCILFVAESGNLDALQDAAKSSFHALGNAVRRKIPQNGYVKDEYSRIMADADEVSQASLELPTGSIDMSFPDGDEYANHLYADKNGKAKIRLNPWEKAAVDEESKNPEMICWLRNLDRKKWSLCLPCEKSGKTGPMFPDLLIFRKDGKDLVMDVIEPHSQAYGDSLAKAKGLANYAKNESRVGRVLFIREKPGRRMQFKCLDMTKKEVRDRVLALNANESLEDVFESHGHDYP